MKNNIFVKSFVIALFILYAVPIALSVDPASVPLPNSVSSQQITDILHTVLQTNKKEIIDDLGKKIDDDFGQLDLRIMNNNKVLFRKAIFALLGGLSIIVFGYAYVANRIHRQYDINFYEKMIDSKIAKFNRVDTAFVDKGMYRSVSNSAGFSVKYKTPEDYYKDLTYKQMSSDLYVNLKKDIMQELEGKKSAQKKKFVVKESFFKKHKKLMYILMIVFFVAVLAVYYYFRFVRK